MIPPMHDAQEAMSDEDFKKGCQKLLVDNLTKIFKESMTKIPTYGGRVVNQSEIAFPIVKFSEFMASIIHQSATEATKVLITYELTKKVREMQNTRKHQVNGDAMPGAETPTSAEKETIIRNPPEENKETPVPPTSSIPS